MQAGFVVPDENDSELIWKWRTDPRTLVHWFDRGTFGLEAHRAWMRRILADPEDHLVLGLVDGRKSGVLRLSTALFKGERYGEVGIYLDPDLTGRGAGSALLKAFPAWSFARRPELRGLVARVSEKNAASRRIFEKAGFSALSGRVWGGLKVPEMIAAVVSCVRQREPLSAAAPAGAERGYAAFFMERPR